MRNRIVLILASLALCTTESFACSCRVAGPYRCSLPNAAVAFAGTVISKQDVDLRRPASAQGNTGGRLRTGDPVPPPDDSYIAVTFQVNEPLRGDFEKTIVIGTDAINSSCSYPFEIGNEYLVFADTYKGHLHTSICSGTR